MRPLVHIARRVEAGERVEVTPTIRCFGHRPAVPDRQRHVHDSDTSTAPQRLRLQAVDDGAPAPPSPSACNRQRRPLQAGDCVARVSGGDCWSNGGVMMMQMRVWKHTVVCLTVLALLLLGRPGAQAQTPPATGKAKVDRLVMGLIEKFRDYIRPWINGSADHMIQHDPAFEWLVEVAPDGQYKPWLADSWELAKDGRSWRVKLHKGVQFHHGYGEFTARDVVHNHALWCDEHYPGRKDTPYVGYKNGICQVERVEVLNDYEIVMHCKVVCLDWPFYYSSASTVVIFSKAQWEQEGEMAYETHPAGTGPYIFKERAPDRYVLFERAPMPHWKWGMVDWKELQMTWTIEEPTRLAQFVAGETHLTEINKDLVDEVVRKGHKLIRSRQVAQQIVLAFGGLYFGTEDKQTRRYTE